MKLTLTPKLLTVLRAIELRKTLAISEVELGLQKSWPEALKNYINALPRNVFDDLGLKRNNGCIDALEKLQIPDKWMFAEESELANYYFGFHG